VFKGPSRAAHCRQAIWNLLRKNPEDTVSILDLIRDLEEYPARDIYRGARALVHKGLIEREDVSYAELAGDGTERVHHLIGVRFVPVWEAGSSRKWR
jgi:hypothetical protein